MVVWGLRIARPNEVSREQAKQAGERQANEEHRPIPQIKAEESPLGDDMCQHDCPMGWSLY
jgi:hypothetical protein